MLPTPRTTHVNFAHVYEPAEDSFLLLDTLSAAQESEFLKQRFPAESPTPLIAEIGTGSGVVLAFAARNAGVIFGRSDVAVLGVDVNEFACRAAEQTVRHALDGYEETTAVALGCVRADLSSCVRPRSVDVLIFNPPYVPSEDVPVADIAHGQDVRGHARFERDSKLLALATDGGADGMVVTNRLLAQLPEVLSVRGVAYVLLCAQNKPEMVKSEIRAWRSGGTWRAETVGSSGKTGGWEKLQIVRIWRVAP